MKTQHFLLGLAVAGGLLLSALAVHAQADENPMRPVGKVVAVRGGVDAMDAKGISRKLQIEGDILIGDTVKTGPRGRVQLMFLDDTQISLGRETEMAIEKYLYDQNKSEGEMVTRVKEGAFRVMGGAITQIAPQNFKTETPTATIGIRGSMYAGRQTGDLLKVVFLGGKGITVGNERGQIAITRTNYGTTVRRGAAPERPRRMSQNDLNDLREGFYGGDDEEEEGNNEDADAAQDGAQDDGGDDGAAANDDEAAADDAGEGGEGGDDGAAAGDAGQDPAGTGGADEDPNDTMFTLDGGGSDDPDSGFGGTPGTNQDTDVSFDDNVFQDPEITAPSDDNSGPIPPEDVEYYEMDGMFAGIVQNAYSGTGGRGSSEKLWSGDVHADIIAASGLIDGIVFAGDQNQNYREFEFSFTTTTVAPGGIYDAQIASGSAVRDVPLGDAGEIYPVSFGFHFDNLGEFVVFEARNIPLASEAGGSTGVESLYSELGVFGIPAAIVPDNGIAWYEGKALLALAPGYEAAAKAIFMDTSAAVNFANGKIMGALDLLGESGNLAFFYGNINGTETEFLRIVGMGDRNQNDLDRPFLVAGEITQGQFFGSAQQGLGLFGDVDVSAVSDAALLQSGNVNTGLFKTETFAAVPTGTSVLNGFMLGLARDTGTEPDTRIFSNADQDPLNFQLSLDRDYGTVTGDAELEAINDANDYTASLDVGGVSGSDSAFVHDRAFIAELSGAVEKDSISEDLRDTGNFLVTDPHEAPVAEWTTWGYWAMNFTDPVNSGNARLVELDQGYWIAGELTPVNYIQNQITTGASGTYNGGAVCTQITDGALAAKFNGSAQFNVFFDLKQVNGNLNFTANAGPLMNFAADIGKNGAALNTFSGGINQVNGMTPDGSSLQGAFFGPNAQSVGATFNATTGNTAYIGVAGGDK